MMKRTFLMMVVLATALSTMGGVGETQTKKKKTKPVSGGTAKPGTSPAKEMPVTADPKDAAAGNNRFAVSLFHKLGSTNGGNLFFSPYSIESALAMTSLGARGTTLSEMNSALQFSGGIPHRAVAAQNALLNQKGERPYRLAVANALWGQQGLSFQPDFLNQSKEFYGAGLNQVDYRGNPEGARKTINDWVEKQTNSKITDLLPKGAVTPDMRLILTNAIYFKGDWAAQFDKDSTNPNDTFHLAAGGTTTVPMMNRTGSYKYFEGSGFQALTLPYKGNDLSMVVLLPRQANGLPALEKSLTAETIAQWTTQGNAREVQVGLPKFKMTSMFSLGEQLKALGMALPFTPRADFSALCTSDQLFISSVVHKAFVDVNEEGTEAAAATGVLMQTTAMRQPVQPVVFRADHPFLFVIRDNRSGAVLFLGRVANPAT